MYLHFSDWSRHLEDLDKKGIPHGGRIIKVFASSKDPREILGRSEIVVVEAESSMFSNQEQFIYSGRQTYRGQDLEIELARCGFGETAKEHIRALFRFANSEKIQTCQYAMSLRDERNGQWLFQHPFADLDGLESALRDPSRRSAAIHLDLFSANSLKNLQKIVDFNQKEFLVEAGSEILSLVSGKSYKTPEGQPIRVESRG